MSIASPGGAADTFRFRTARRALYSGPVKSIVLSAILAGSLTLAAQAAPAISLQQVAEGFVSPTALQSAPNADYMLVSDQAGIIYKVKSGAPIEPWLDLTSKITKLNQGFDERGLLGFALHPDYANNGRFFVVYSAPLKNAAMKGWDHTWTLSEFKAENGATKMDSEKILLEIDEPQFNHNGGCIAFGGDGHLYAAVGDGGNANDKDENNKKLDPPGHVPGGNG